MSWMISPSTTPFAVETAVREEPPTKQCGPDWPMLGLLPPWIRSEDGPNGLLSWVNPKVGSGGGPPWINVCLWFTPYQWFQI